MLVHAGGPALNAAITFAHMGGTAVLISMIGNSIWSGFIKEELNKYRVKLYDIAEGYDFSPPVSSIIINSQNGSSTIFTSPASSSQSFKFDISKINETAKLVLTDGFLVSELGDLIQRYSASGAEICLDGGSWKSDTSKIIDCVSIAICSERFKPPGTDGISSVIKYLHDHGIKQIAITSGNKPIIGSDNGHDFTISIEPIKPIDTLGAGDIMHGTFCWYYSQSHDFEASLKQSAQVATKSCQWLGTRAWMNAGK